MNTSLERTTAAAGLAVGALLLARPQWLLDRVAPAYPRDRQWIARLLGARLVAQHAAVLVAPRRRLVRAGATVDLLHAATMVPLLRSPRYGRAARLSGALAAAYGVGGWGLAAGGRLGARGDGEAAQRLLAARTAPDHRYPRTAATSPTLG